MEKEREQRNRPVSWCVNAPVNRIDRPSPNRNLLSETSVHQVCMPIKVTSIGDNQQPRNGPTNVTFEKNTLNIPLNTSLKINYKDP